MNRAERRLHLHETRKALARVDEQGLRLGDFNIKVQDLATWGDRERALAHELLRREDEFFARLEKARRWF